MTERRCVRQHTALPSNSGENHQDNTQGGRSEVLRCKLSMILDGLLA
jgi:hypothetical protein